MNKPATWLTAGLFIVSSQTAYSQGAPSVLDEVFYKSMSGSLVPLERETASVETKTEGLGGRVDVVASVRGESSSIRIQSGNQLVFVVRIAPSSDPKKFRLYRFLSQDGKRKVVLTSRDFYGNVKVGLGQVPLSISSEGGGVYQLILHDPVPGEYGFSSDDTNDSFLFAVVAR
jgi:hypothetical protein